MLAISIVVFVAVFAVLALILANLGQTKPSKQTRLALEAALKVAGAKAQEEVIDVRKGNILLSGIPWVNTLLTQFNGIFELRRTLEQADLKWTPGRLILSCVVCLVVSAYLIHERTNQLPLALALGFAVGTLPYLFVRRKRAQRLKLFQQKLPDVLDLMVSALRAGHSMSGALGTAAKEAPEPVGREFRLCFEEQNFGIDLRTTLQNLMDRVPLQDLRIISTALLIHKESGGNLAEVLDKTSHVIRERFRAQQQIKVHTAQGRLTGWILTGMPIALAILLNAVNPSYMKVLFTNPLGQKMIITVIIMNAIGLLLIRKIVNIRV